MSLECGWVLVLTFRRSFPSSKEEGSLTPLQPVYNEFIHPSRNRVLSDMRLCKMLWANTRLIKVEEAKGEILLSRSLLVLEFACFLGWGRMSSMQQSSAYSVRSFLAAPSTCPTSYLHREGTAVRPRYLLVSALSSSCAAQQRTGSQLTWVLIPAILQASCMILFKILICLQFPAVYSSN